MTPERDSAPVVGVDVGGTFTDLISIDAANGAVRVAKVPSQRGDEARGFLAGLDALATGSASIVHGTTVGTNALLERKGARVGVITTRGFRDVLEMRRRDRPRTWGLWGTFEPVVPRDLRVEVGERTLASGQVRDAVQSDEVAAAARTLIERGAEALAIIFINAYANDANERAAEAAARAVWPNEFVTCSSAMLAEFREFERASTTALNAYLQPLLGRYLGRLEDALLTRPADADALQVVQSNGGVMSSATARRWPVRTALSGPAAGVMAALAIGRAAGCPNLVTCDLGGTSFDVSVVADGEAATCAQSTIDFGVVIRTPMVEIETIGAGGGSIAKVDAGGLLRVGPESAGSVPGPVCYGRGNERPTLTDANLVLGRINAEAPIGGQQVRLDVDAARVALDMHVGTPLGLDSEAAASAVVRVAEAAMASALRLVSVERGHDPREFLAMPFGGGGALHVCALITEVGLAGALVPRYPGVTSALGCVLADTRHDIVRTLNAPVDGLDVDALHAAMCDGAQATAKVALGSGLPLERLRLRFSLDMHYVGQTHSVRVRIAECVREPRLDSIEDDVAAVGIDAIRAAFERVYARAFGSTLDGHAIRIVSLHCEASGERPAFDLALLATGAQRALADACLGSRPVRFGDSWRDTPVYARLDVPVGAEVEGPAIFEQPDATVLVEPQFIARTDALGNLRVARRA